ncbi:MAG: LuxR family transcriptional regulator [Steroidobacteraceae bacterium]
MDPLDVAQRFIEICQRERAPTGWLTARLHESIEALGFRYFACCARVDPLHAPPQALMIHNYPAAWAQRFSREKLYEIDPVLRHAECDPEAFFWDNLLQTEPLTAAQRKMLADASSLGIAHGFTAPIHLSWLPGTLRVSCSFVPDGRTVQQVNYFVAKAMAIEMYTILSRAQAPRRESSSVVLSPRERQCLSLAAQGKDDWTIGRLLGLSPDTAHSYFKRIMHRLEVGTRMQAVIWALGTGQISFDDLPSATERPPSSG